MKVNEMFLKEMLKEPPQVEWMREVQVELNELVSGNKRLIGFRDQMIAQGGVESLNKNIDFNDPIHKKLIPLMFNMDLMFTLTSAQEILVRNGYLDMYIKGIDRAIEYINKPWDMTDFKIPFEEIVITFEENKMYFPTFIQIFKMNESYIDPKTQEASPVYVLKEMYKKERFKSMAGIEHGYVASMEAIIIPSKLPRIFIPTYVSKYCQTCAQRVSTGMLKNIEKRADITTEFDYCMKTVRSAEICSLERNVNSKGMGITHAQHVFGWFMFVYDLMGRLYRSPKKIEKIREQVVQGKTSLREVKENIADRHYIELKDKTYTYVGPKRERAKGGTHASPVEHYRRPHYRHCKSGKVVEVKHSFINEGNKKPIYVIKGDSI